MSTAPQRAAALLAFALAGCASISERVESALQLDGRNSLVRRGETFLGLSGGGCFGHCPEYEIYVFDTGRVIFRGNQYTATKGVVELRIESSGYRELEAMLKKFRAMTWHPRINCATDHPRFDIYSSRGKVLRVAQLDLGCNGHVRDLQGTLEAFTRISGTQALIGAPENETGPDGARL